MHTIISVVQSNTYTCTLHSIQLYIPYLNVYCHMRPLVSSTRYLHIPINFNASVVNTPPHPGLPPWRPPRGKEPRIPGG